LTTVAPAADRALSAASAVTDTPPLAVRILLATAAGLWAVLVPGQAAALMEQPLQWPRWLRRPARRAPRAIPALRPLDTA
jgi:hypothetical protein